MRPVTVTASDASQAVKYSGVVALDHYISSFSVSLSVVKSGTVNYTVQYTFDNIWADSYNPATGNWIDQTNQTGVTANTATHITFPITGARIKLNSGSGSVTMTVIQAGRP